MPSAISSNRLYQLRSASKPITVKGALVGSRHAPTKVQREVRSGP